MADWIVQIEPGVWLAAIEGDPGRTLVRDNAQPFKSMVAASRALTAARKYRPFVNASIDDDPNNQDTGQSA